MPSTAAPAAPALATAPVTSAAPAAAAGAGSPASGVALHQAIETVRMTIEIGARSGYSQARIQLSPPELGGIRIQLHQTAEGLVAR